MAWFLIFDSCELTGPDPHPLSAGKWPYSHLRSDPGHHGPGRLHGRRLLHHVWREGGGEEVFHMQNGMYTPSHIVYMVASSVLWLHGLLKNVNYQGFQVKRGILIYFYNLSFSRCFYPKLMTMTLSCCWNMSIAMFTFTHFSGLLHKDTGWWCWFIVDCRLWVCVCVGGRSLFNLCTFISWCTVQKSCSLTQPPESNQSDSGQVRLLKPAIIHTMPLMSSRGRGSLTTA